MSDVRALLKIERALEGLDHEGQKRVLKWIGEKVERGPIVATKLLTRNKPSDAAAAPTNAAAPIAVPACGVATAEAAAPAPATH